jgi:hypothetical protein
VQAMRGDGFTNANTMVGLYRADYLTFFAVYQLEL